MVELVTSLMQIEMIITILIGMAAFATVLTVASPYFESDQL